MHTVKVIGFDADDTLWVNEPYFQEVEQEFCQLFAHKYSEKELSAELFATEMQNLSSYGYGAKAFTLSMVETALRIDKECSAAMVAKILDMGKSLLSKPVVLLDGVLDLLEQLNGRYRLVVATKGDLLDQQRKLQKSGLVHYFNHVEIMSDKKTDDYLSLIRLLDIEPKDFLMVGNSLKSDILPVVDIGGKGVYVPFHTTWQHEVVSDSTATEGRYHTISSLTDFHTIL